MPELKTVASPSWPQEVHGIFRDHVIAQVAYVPDGGLANLISRCDADCSMRAIPLTSEEEGIGLLTGAWLGGGKGVLLMQSSGVGNCINALSLPAVCRIPIFMLVAMRGEWAEFNPWQLPMGQATPAILRAMGVMVEHARNAAELPHVVDAGLRYAFQTNSSVAVLIGQQILGAKKFGEDSQ